MTDRTKVPTEAYGFWANPDPSGYRPRWQVALLLLTMPIWFLPAILIHGFVDLGLDILGQFKDGLSWIFTGRAG